MSDTAAPARHDRVLGLVRRDHVQRYSTLVVLILMFLVYTFVYNLAFDRIFGLPASAR